MKTVKIFLTILLLLIMSFNLISCDDNNVNENKTNNYNEENRELPKNISTIYKMKKLDVSKYVLISTNSNNALKYYISNDSTQSWTDSNFSTTLDITNIQKVDVFNSGNLLIYTSSDSNNKHFYILNLDGTYNEINGLNELKTNINKIEISDNNEIFIETSNNEIIQTNIQGKVLNTFKINKDTQDYSWTIVKNILFVYSDGILSRISLSTGKKDNNYQKMSKYKNSEITLFNSSNEDEINFYNRNGIYKYDLKKNKVSKVISSKVLSLSDTDMYIDYIFENNNDYLVDYWIKTGSYLLKNYTYSNNNSNIKKSKLSIYSLYKNPVIEQAIIKYQKMHPDIDISYRIGIDDKVINKDDAIKKLNSELNSKNGPDILILDGLSSEKYIKSGILENINDLINKNENKLFDNVVKYYTQNGHIYEFPLSISFEYLIGNHLNNTKNLNDLCNNLAVNTDTKFLGIYCPKDLIYTLYNNCVPSWINEDSSINNKNIKEFLQDSKAIYNNVKNNYSNEEIEKYNETLNKYLTNMTEEEYYTHFYHLTDFYSLINAPQNMCSITKLYCNDDLTILNTILKNNTSLQMNLWAGESNPSFIPSNILALNSNSSNKSIAKGFLDSLISEPENYFKYNSFLSTNKEYCKKQLLNCDNDFLSFDAPDKNRLTLKLATLSDEEVSAYLNSFEQISTGNSNNFDLLIPIFNYISQYILSEKSLDETIKLIDNKLEIMLQE